MPLVGCLLALIVYGAAAFAVSCGVGRYLASLSARYPEVRR